MKGLALLITLLIAILIGVAMCSQGEFLPGKFFPSEKRETPRSGTEKFPLEICVDILPYAENPWSIYEGDIPKTPRNHRGTFKINNTTVKTLRPGVKEKLEYYFFPAGGSTFIRDTNNRLAQGQSTAKFNGQVAYDDVREYHWRAHLLEGATEATKPAKVEVCLSTDPRE